DGDGRGGDQQVLAETRRDAVGTVQVGGIREPAADRCEEVHQVARATARASAKGPEPAHGVRRRWSRTRTRSTTSASAIDARPPTRISVVKKLWRRPSKMKKPRPPNRSP